MNWIERAGAQELFFDFCLWKYQPAVPYHHKFLSSNLLFHSFDVVGVSSRFYELVQAIRTGMGHSRTVWGVKKVAQRIGWEFYFYDYQRQNRTRSVTRLLEVIQPYIACTITANEHLRYFMFSLDISEDLLSGRKSLEEIHMYIGNPGSTVSSGICYSLTVSGMRLENFYFFFDAKRQAGEILAKASNSAHVDSTIDLRRILWPEMWNCKVIVVANKQQNDSIYFSGINIDQLILFLKQLNYPSDLVCFIETNRMELDHLQFDVGFDYRLEGNELVILKSGYYGIF